MKVTEKTWCGKVEKCDLCKTAIVSEFVDGATRMGPWAIMCKKCHMFNGRGLGVGQGQHYVKQPDGLFHKVVQS